MKRQTFGQCSAMIAALALLFTTVSCNFGNLALPKKVEVSTQAAYRVQFGDLAPLLEEALSGFSPSDMLENAKAGLGDTVDLWDYDDESGVLSYVLHMNFDDKMPNFDIKSYLDGLDIDSKLGELGGDGLGFDPVEIPIPAFSFGDFSIPSIEIPDFSSKVSDSMKLPPINEIYTLETAVGIADQNLEVRTDETKGVTYDAITVKSGGIRLSLERIDSNAVGGDYSLSVNITIKKLDDTVIATNSANLTSGGNLDLNLTGKDLPQNFNVSITGNTTGTSNTPHQYSCSLGFANNFKLDKVSGLNASASALGIDAMPQINPDPIDMSSLVGMFESATLGDDSSITLQAKTPKLASDSSKYFFESGLTITPTIKIEGIGLSASFADDGDTTGYLIKKKCDLGAASLLVTDADHELTVVDGSIDFSLTDATINFDDGSSATTIPISLNVNIDTIKEAVINLKSEKYSAMPSEFNIADTLGDDQKTLPSAMLQFVKRITFGEDGGAGVYYKHDSDGVLKTTDDYKAEGLGISCNVVNSLPVGNNIPLTIDSSLFDIHLTPSFSGKGNETPVAEKWVSYPDLDLSTYNESNPATIDLKVTMGTEDGDKRTVTLSNLKFGDTYKLGLSDVSFKFDWDTITANLSSIELKSDENNPIDLSALDISSMLSNLNAISAADLAKIEVPSMPVFFYLQNPGDGATDGVGNLLNGLGLKGTMNIGDTYLLGSKEGDVVTSGTVSFMGTSVPWDSVTDGSVNEDSAITPYITKYTDAVESNWTKDTRKYSFSADLADIINAALAGTLSSSSESESKLTLSYNLQVTGASGTDTVVYHDMLKDDGSSSESSGTGLTMDMAARLSLALNLTDDIVMNLSSFIGNSSESESGSGSGSESESSSEPKDLFNRTSENNPLRDFANATSAIDYAKISIKVKNFLLKGVDFGLTVDDTHDGDTRYSGVVMNDTLRLKIDKETGNGEISMTFSSEDFENVLESTYFDPDINLVLRQGTLKVSRDLLDGLSSSSETAAEDKFSAKVMFEVKGSGKPAELSLSDLSPVGGLN